MTSEHRGNKQEAGDDLNSAQMSSTESMEEAVSVFIAFRPRLFRIAHHILGSAADVEDVVQDAWLRWQHTDRTQVLDPPAYLAQITVRLALNVVQSARSRYESSAGPRLPDMGDTGPDLPSRAERAEALDQALDLLLEKLNPRERAAYILRVAFDYPYSEIADNLQLSPINTRQIVSRARKRLVAEGRKPARTVEHKRLVNAFVTAAQYGNLTGLENVLACDTDRDPAGDGRRRRRPPHSLTPAPGRACDAGRSA
ncbi:sigma-70 family RNA polymerase sigma factor [Streptomyces sp. JH14]|uniref:sigma-70 family RNA polymerase sigma factor n=1 Tax=Streptomyces sp. JH14 TaxID=2793630 RepID=UPI0023F64F20|nr:sigma-70 family RNA polymerase sigma factor [Streptomyces sp. JH14]MDF6046228.1 sigma-70 family RNA polymerase sigma factor [Streptomyces sp. JH14]